MNKKIIRKKYVIMYTDMLDSTKRYVTQGDDKAFGHVLKHFELLKPIVTENSGTIIKTIGDSIMAIFENPNDGVHSAVIMQQTLYDYNKGKDLDGQIDIRIGLHYGEVTEKDNDVFGDKVNTAARIKAMADGYTIFISQELKNNIDEDLFETIYMGDYDAKGKLEPIVVYGIIWSKNVNWLKNIYQQTRKKLTVKQNKNKIKKNRKEGKIGQSEEIGVKVSFEIVTQPAGAKVWLDNRLLQKQTPLTTNHKVGALDLRIEKPGFKTVNDYFEIYEDLSNDIFIQLKDLRGSILIETDEPGFSVSISKILTKNYKTPYKFKNMFADKYLISVKNDKKFSYPEEVELKEKQHLIFKPTVILYSNIGIVSKYRKNILYISNINSNDPNLFKGKIKYKPDMTFLKGISHEVSLKPGRYLLESETYPFLYAQLEINSQEFKVIDFDEYLPKVQFNANCGKYESSVRIEYIDRNEIIKFNQAGNISDQVLPGKSSITFKHKYTNVTMNHDFTKQSFEFNFEEVIKKAIKKRIFAKALKIIPFAIILFCVILLGPSLYKKYISETIPLISNKIAEVKTILKQKEKVPEIAKQIYTGSLQINCSAVNVMIKITGNEIKKEINIGNKTNFPVGKYQLTIYANNYETQTHDVVIKKDQFIKKTYNLKPSFETPKDLIFVKGDVFTMGDSSYDISMKSHKVRVSDFYIGKFEVTQEEWGKIFENNPAFFKGNNLPIENISWFEVIKYCNIRSESEGLSLCYTITGINVSCDFSANGYRLPTEAEWEFAAKGGIQTKNYDYCGSNIINEVAWFQGNSSNKTHPVGTKICNELKIFDMSGNVWEWCWDLYGKYSEKLQINPQGSNTGNLRTRRQGSWNRGERYSMIGYRETKSPDKRSNSIGFRIVRTTLGENEYCGL